MNKEHRDILLQGKVQKIGFRYSAKEKAEELNLYGYARNLKDGSVFIEVEGSCQNIDRFLKWLKLSPGLSKVESAEMNEDEVKGYREFQIF